LKTLTNQQSTGYTLSDYHCLIFSTITKTQLGRLMNTKIKASVLVVFSILSFFLIFSYSLADTSKNPDTEALTPANSSSDKSSDPSKMGSESGIYYTVKKGDTLWDLSKRFNSNAWKWPGMWSDNKTITNPHLIYPGQKIKLFFRSDMERLKRLHTAGTDTLKNESGKTVDAVEPVSMSGGLDTASDNSTGLSLPYYHYSKIGSVGFMTEKPSVAHGYIFKVKGVDHLMINKGDEVFIKDMNDKSLVPGAKYYCYQILTPKMVKKKVKEEKRINLLGRKTKKTEAGYQHYITGIIQITSLKSGYAQGTVVQSYRPISLKDYLIPFKLRSPDITLTASKEGLSGSIITSEETESMFGDDKVAFIDKGSKDGVKVGQMYNIFYPEEKDSSELFGGKKLFVPVDFASFIVLLTEDHMSTVLITSAYQGISAGDEWHYPQE
jgi:hypothetical protein